jgi:hypothetical protein
VLFRFSVKFQRIVQQEQRANFISRLHRGKLDIIPWPVIESKDFYKTFSTLKKRLDSQKTSHTTAGEFLYTIKTLMAKLKVSFTPFFESGIFKFTSFHRPTTGERSLVRRLILFCVNSVSDFVSGRDHDRPSCQDSLRVAADRLSYRVF